MNHFILVAGFVFLAYIAAPDACAFGMALAFGAFTWAAGSLSS